MSTITPVVFWLAFSLNLTKHMTEFFSEWVPKRIQGTGDCGKTWQVGGLPLWSLLTPTTECSLILTLLTS